MLADLGGRVLLGHDDEFGGCESCNVKQERNQGNLSNKGIDAVETNVWSEGRKGVKAWCGDRFWSGYRWLAAINLGSAGGVF